MARAVCAECGGEYEVRSMRACPDCGEYVCEGCCLTHDERHPHDEGNDII